MMGEMRKILVIDDELDARKILIRRLESSGYKVIEAADGMSGLNLAKQEMPDLILLDIMMPGLDGLKTYQALRKEAPTQQVPVIFITALSPENNLSRPGLDLIAFTKYGVELDANYAILGKPYRPADLLREVEKALGKKRD